MAGSDHLTVADLCLGVTYSQLQCCGHIDTSGMRALNEWSERVRGAIPDYHSACGEGETLFADHFKQVYAEAKKNGAK